MTKEEERVWLKAIDLTNEFVLRPEIVKAYASALFPSKQWLIWK